MSEKPQSNNGMKIHFFWTWRAIISLKRRVDQTYLTFLEVLVEEEETLEWNANF